MGILSRRFRDAVVRPFEPAPSDDLTPLVVAASGRSGTTTMMQLLGSSLDIVFDRIYAYENAYLSYLVTWSKVPLEGARSKGPWRRAAIDVENYVERHGTVGGMSWEQRPSITTADGSFADELLKASWSVFSRRARIYGRELGGVDAQPVYYAETGPVWVADRAAAVLGGKTILLVRDPRDQFLSIMAFNAKRGKLSFGVQESDTPETFARRFAERQKVFLARVIATDESFGSTVVTFDDLTRRRAECAARLSDWLGVTLSPEVDVDHSELHRTSESDRPRWQSEMSAEILAIFEESLAQEIDAMGWGWG